MHSNNEFDLETTHIDGDWTVPPAATYLNTLLSYVSSISLLTSVTFLPIGTWQTWHTWGSHQTRFSLITLSIKSATT